jgi:spore maturation protein CgeB
MTSSFRLLIISSMYPGYLKDFYERFPEYYKWDYDMHYNALLSDSTEFAASYTRAFTRNGISVECIIVNDRKLQKKWAEKNSLGKLNSEELILRRISQFRPDVLWIEDLRFITPPLLNLIRKQSDYIKLLSGYHCAPVNPVSLEKLKMLDLVITCTPGLKADLINAGINSCLVYHGFDSDLLPAINTSGGYPQNDVLFTGSLILGGGYHNERIALIEYLLKNGIDISLFVNTESIIRIFVKKVLFLLNSLLKKMSIKDPEKIMSLLHYGKYPVEFYPAIIRKHLREPKYGFEMYQLLKGSGIVLNNHGDVAGDFAGNMRLFEATGVGSCLLTDNKSNLSELFNVDNEIVVYNSPEECAEKIRWLLKNDSERKRIAASGKKRTLEHHTVDARCKSIIEILKKELIKKGFN